MAVGEIKSEIMQLLLLSAVAAKAEEFQGVKQQLKILLLVVRNRHVMERAMVQRLGATTVHAGEMVAVVIHGRIQRFSGG